MNSRKIKKISASLSFGIPADIVQNHFAELKKKGIRYRKAVVRVGEFEVPACIFPLKTMSN